MYPDGVLSATAKPGPHALPCRFIHGTATLFPDMVQVSLPWH